VSFVNKTTLIAIGLLVFVVGAATSVLLLHYSTPSEKGGEPLGEKPVVVEGPKTPLSGVVLSTQQLEAYRDLLEKIVAQARSLQVLVPGVPLILPALVAESISSAIPLATQPGQLEYSATNVQVAGIDEEDVVKTNGYLIVVARGDGVAVIDAVGRRVLGYINTTSVKGLYLQGNTLVVIRADLSLGVTIVVNESLQYTVEYPLVDVLVYDLTQPSSPRLLYRVNVTCVFGGSRLVENYLYVVGYVESFRYTGDAVAPLIPLVNERPIPRENIVETGSYASYIVVLALDISSGEYTVKAYTGGRVEWIYMVRDKLYVAWSSELDFVYYEALLEILEYLESTEVIPSSKYEELKSLLEQRALGRVLDELNKIAEELRDREPIIREVNITDETLFLVLTVSGLEVSEQGSFSVPGLVLDQFAIEELRGEHGRFLVVATTVHNYSLEFTLGCFDVLLLEPIVIVEDNSTTTVTYTTTSKRVCTFYWFWLPLPSSTFNAVYIVDENLNVVSRLEGLAAGERVYAARLIKNILYLVTFRIVDPLFAIDLSDPYNPRVLGYLKIPGFSEYLHPLSENLLLGVGLSGWYLKISLFNVTDPTNMSEVVKLHFYKYSWSEVLVNHRAFMIDTRHSIVVIPVSTYTWSTWGPRPVPVGFLVIRYSVENASLQVLAVIDLEGAMRALCISDKLYLVGYSRILVYKLPELELAGEIEY
jgi:inhibitor of cysteine peptidase